MKFKPPILGPSYALRCKRKRIKKLTKTFVVYDDGDVGRYQVGTSVLPEDQLTTEVESSTNIVLGLEISYALALQEFLLDF